MKNFDALYNKILAKSDWHVYIRMRLRVCFFLNRETIDPHSQKVEMQLHSTQG